jgi:hypothetical protein
MIEMDINWAGFYYLYLLLLWALEGFDTLKWRFN